MYEISKDVPMPSRGKGRPKFHGMPFASMAVGDSFFVTRIDGHTLSMLSSAIRSYLMSDAATQAGVKMSYRKLTENGTLGYRVWRTK